MTIAREINGTIPKCTKGGKGDISGSFVPTKVSFQCSLVVQRFCARITHALSVSKSCEECRAEDEESVKLVLN